MGEVKKKVVCLLFPMQPLLDDFGFEIFHDSFNNNAIHESYIQPHPPAQFRVLALVLLDLLLSFFQ